MEKRCVAEHAERPLVRVRDERDAVVPQHRRRAFPQLAGEIAALHALGADELPSETARVKSFVAANASQSASPCGLSVRRTASSVTNTRLSGSRKEPGSTRAAVMPTCGALREPSGPSVPRRDGECARNRGAGPRKA